MEGFKILNGLSYLMKLVLDRKMINQEHILITLLGKTLKFKYYSLRFILMHINSNHCILVFLWHELHECDAFRYS